jgi:NADH:ubiquinone oxidoreductase subunit E
MRNIGISEAPLDPAIVALAQQHGHRREALVDIFRALQAQYGGLTDNMISDVARVLRLSPAQAYGVASFYAMLSTHRGPPHIIRLCDSPPCWLRGAAPIRAAVEATNRGAGRSRVRVV